MDDTTLLGTETEVNNEGSTGSSSHSSIFSQPVFEEEQSDSWSTVASTVALCSHDEDFTTENCKGSSSPLHNSPIFQVDDIEEEQQPWSRLFGLRPGPSREAWRALASWKLRTRVPIRSGSTGRALPLFEDCQRSDEE